MTPAEFPETSFAEWRAAARGAHDDAGFERRLTSTIDGALRVEPLYTRENAPEGPAIPAGPHARRWILCQTVEIPDPDGARLVAQVKALGATGFWLQPSPGAGANGSRAGRSDAGAADARALVAAALGETTDDGLWIDVDPREADEFSGLLTLVRSRPAGGVVVDPAGGLQENRTRALDALADLVSDVAGAARGVRVLWTDLRGVHARGADAVTELGVAAAALVETIDAMRERGHALDAIAARVGVTLEVPDDLFTGVATIRALRGLWARILGAYGADACRPLWIHARTSGRVETRRDHWSNLLRGTLGAFAIGVGGADSIGVRPFDGDRRASNAFGHRMAINTQRILLDEAHLAAVADPVRGSWYVESLTDALARAGWDTFREIVRAGGLSGAPEGAGWTHVHERIHRHADVRRRQVADRTTPVVGVTLFAPTPGSRAAAAPASPDVDDRMRWSEPVEALQDDADAHAARTGSRPGVSIVVLGSPRAIRDRLAFVHDVLAAGGLVVSATHELPDGDPVGALDVDRLGAHPVVVCGPDDVCSRLVPDLARHLAAGGIGEIVVAGRIPDDARETWTSAGVTGSVHVGSDIVALHRTLADAIGIVRGGGRT